MRSEEVLWSDDCALVWDNWPNTKWRNWNPVGGKISSLSQIRHIITPWRHPTVITNIIFESKQWMRILSEIWPWKLIRFVDWNSICFICQLKTWQQSVEFHNMDVCVFSCDWKNISLWNLTRSWEKVSAGPAVVSGQCGRRQEQTGASHAFYAIPKLCLQSTSKSMHFFAFLSSLIAMRKCDTFCSEISWTGWVVLSAWLVIFVPWLAQTRPKQDTKP